MPELGEEEKRKTSRSGEFRYIPCDSIELGMGSDGVKLLFGVKEFDGTILELVGVHMSHRNAAFLKTALEKALSHFEKEAAVKTAEPDLSRKSE